MKLPEVIHPQCAGFDELCSAVWRIARKNILEDPKAPKTRFMKEGFDRKNFYFWDTCFMTQYTRYAPELLPGIETLDKFYSVQRSDGFIPRCFDYATGRQFGSCPEDVNPPLAAWCELDHLRQTGQIDRLEHVIFHLIRFDQWIEKNRRRKDGTYWFSDGAGSGMDNSPRTARRNKSGNDVGWVDLAAQQALAAESISKLAHVANDAKIEREYLEKYEERIGFLNRRHWCEKIGLHLDLLLQGLETENYRAYFSAVKTAASFWVLPAGACSADRLKRIIGHLLNPEEFNRPHPVPSLSFDNPNYSGDGCYWQGGVWAPINYMIVRGLLRSGEYRVAREIALQHLNAINNVYRQVEPHTIWEAYSPEKTRPASNDSMEYGRETEQSRVRDDFCGWSALGPISMMIEAVLGIECDYPNRKILWHSNCMEEHGIQNLRFGPHQINLTAKAVKNKNEIPEIVLESPVGIDIEFKRFPEI